MRKITWLMIAAAFVVIVLVVYSSVQCRVTRDQFGVSPLKAFVVSVIEGYAVGFSFNITNLGGCEVTIDLVWVTIREATYRDGTHAVSGASESESQLKTIPPGQSAFVSFAFQSYFEKRPTILSLKVDVTLVGAGRITIFDGVLNIPLD